MARIRKPPLILSGALLILFAVLFMYASVMPPPSAAPAPIDPVRFKAAEERDIRASLSDPESANFRNDLVSTFSKVPVVCGEINFKNGTGGYVGFRRFVSAPTIRHFEDETGPQEMSRLWRVLCDRAK